MKSSNQKANNNSLENQNISLSKKLLSEAFKFHSKGDIINASKHYQLYINYGFTDPNVYSNYAVICKQIGKIDQSLILLRKAVKLYPDDADINSNLGNMLCDIGDLEEAQKYIKIAINLKPNFAVAHSNHGRVLNELGQLEEAELSFRKAIEIDPNLAGAYSNLGNILKDLGNLQEAEATTRKSIRLNSNFHDAHLNLGSILKALNNLYEAEISTRKAIELKPDSAIAYSNLGSILKDQGKSKEAEVAIRKSIKLNPNFSDSYLNLGTLLKDQGNIEESILSYKEALLKDKNNTIILVELISTLAEISSWKEIEEYITLLKQIDIKYHNFNPHKYSYFEDSPSKSLIRARNFFNSNHKRNASKLRISIKEKVHIGYFSADFREHPVMYLILQLLESHDQSRFKVFIYSLTEKEDKYTNRVKGYPFNYRSIINKNDIDIVDIVKKDNIDIAIDLMGYTSKNKMNIFSYRLAPIQINYLGFAGTTGSDKIDYLIADKVVIPEDYKKYYSEKIIHMPNSFMPFDNNRKISKNIYNREDFQLNKGSFVLAAFHKNYKITPKEILIWSRILKNISNSIIWLSDTNETAKSNLLKLFEEQGVDLKNIIFTKRMQSNEEHLARHGCADLFIDTFNYNGHSTVIDSLWAGLPVVCLIGKSYAARVSASLLKTLGLDQLIAKTTNEYEDIIINLSKNPKKLIEIKDNLILSKRSNPLFDSKKYTSDLENIYLELAKNLHL